MAASSRKASMMTNRVGSSCCWVSANCARPGSRRLLRVLSSVAALNASTASGFTRMWTSWMITDDLANRRIGAGHACPAPRPLSGRPAPRARDGDARVQVDVLDRVQQRRAFLHRPLEGLAARDEAHAAGALVDDGRTHRFGQIARTRRGAAAVDQAGAAHV